LYWLVRTAFSLMFRLDVRGVDAMPAGPVIVAGNHTSGFDPPVVGAVLRRPAWYMAKEELFRIPGFGALIRRLHAYPVRRGKPDRRSLRTTHQILRAGGAVIIFPEGHRSATGALQDPRRGVAFLARLSGAPVVPVGIVGPYRFGGMVSLWFGEPLRWEPGETLEHFGGRLMKAIDAQIRAARASRGLAGPRTTV
jgi:1-acyl-sn-glycerol-3-phosphate acyltransferase